MPGQQAQQDAALAAIRRCPGDRAHRLVDGARRLRRHRNCGRSECAEFERGKHGAVDAYPGDTAGSGDREHVASDRRDADNPGVRTVPAGDIPADSVRAVR